MPYAVGYNFRTRKKPLPEAVSQQEIYDLGKTLQRNQDKALFYFLYLSGARISEALQVQNRDIKLVNLELPSGKTVKCVAVDLITLKKRKGIPRRTVHINLHGLDYEMFKVIQEQRKDLPLADSFMFNYGEIGEGKDGTHRARNNAYYRIRKIHYVVKGIVPPDGRIATLDRFHFYNHYLRHCRTYHLKTVYRLNGDEARAFFGWSSSALWDTYGQETAVDVLERIVEKDGGLIR